jgi:hypothetical protein
MGKHSLGRPTVSSLPRADIVQFYRDGHVRPGLLTLPLGINGHHVENANITWVPCNYGGARPQWICPRCNEHVLHLYFACDRFACRHCWRLGYQTQSWGREDRALMRMHRVYDQLDRDECGYAMKPKWMRWRTFNRMIDAADAAEWKSLGG